MFWLPGRIAACRHQCTAAPQLSINRLHKPFPPYGHDLSSDCISISIDHLSKNSKLHHLVSCAFTPEFFDSLLKLESIYPPPLPALAAPAARDESWEKRCVEQPPCFDSPKFGSPARSRRPARLILGRIFPPIVSALVRSNGQSRGPDVQAAKGEAVADGGIRGSCCTKNAQKHKCCLLFANMSFKMGGSPVIKD